MSTTRNVCAQRKKSFHESRSKTNEIENKVTNKQTNKMMTSNTNQNQHQYYHHHRMFVLKKFVITTDLYIGIRTDTAQ